MPLKPLYPDSGILDPSKQLGGCLNLSDSQVQSYLSHLMPKRSREGALLVRKWLKEALRKESISVPVRSRAGAVPPSELKALAESLAHAAGRGPQELCLWRLIVHCYADIGSGLALIHLEMGCTS